MTLITALISPFHTDMTLDEEALRRLLRQQVAAKVDGVVMLGTTAETPTLSEAEQERILTIGIEEGRPLRLIAGTGSNSTAGTIAATQRAAAFGYDCALVVSPYYSRPSQEGLIAHFTAVADTSPIPLLLYNHPKRCGVAITADTLAALADHSNIIGIKEASGSLDAIAHAVATIKSKRPDFAIYTGNDSEAYLTHALGGNGVISVASNLIPEVMAAFIQNPALEEHYRLLPLFEALASQSNPIPIKAALNSCGFPAGPLRLPLIAMEATEAATLQQLTGTIVGALQW